MPLLALLFHRLLILGKMQKESGINETAMVTMYYYLGILVKGNIVRAIAIRYRTLLIREYDKFVFV